MATITARLLNDTGLLSTDLVTSIDTLTGTGNPGALVTFKIGGVPIGTTTADTLGNWTFTPSGLADGRYKVAISEPGSSTSLTFTLDTTTPVVTERLTSDTGASSTDSITSKAGLTGTGSAKGVVTLTEGTTVLGTTTVNSTGNWSFTPTGLTQGPHTIVATETDLAGNVGSPTSLTFTLDTAAPVLTERLVNDTGASATDNITADPTLTGTAEANSVVTLRQGTTQLGTTMSDASGNWTFAPTGLAQGKHTIVASETDVAGNTGTISLAFTLDSTLPAITERLTKDTGASSTDNITNNPALTGGGNANSVVTLTEGATVLGTATANSKGTWSFTPTGLAQGPHTIVATEQDASGNTGTASLTFTLDTVAPVVTEKLANDTGTPGDNITSDPALAGTGEANSVVTLRQGTTVLGTVTADASGNWTFTPTGLTQGKHTIVASDTDLAGNTGTASLSFTLNSVAPVVSETLVSDTGSSATDKITANPGLTGGGDVNAVVTLTEGATVLGTATAGATGAWTFNPTGLAQGAHTIVASETNATGNTGTASLSFTLDSVAPVVTETLANDTGTPGDNITSDPTLTGTAEANGRVALTEGATSIGTVTAGASGNWTFTPTGLTQGKHTIVASDTDLAGNTGTASLSFTLNSVAPVVSETLVNDTGGSATDKITANPGLTGGGDANAVVTLTEGATVLGTATADATGAWTFNPTALAQGAHTIVASETNATGNTGTASLSFTLDSVAPVVTEQLANDTGTPGDNITSDPTLTGTADANGQVVLTEGATSIGTVTADATGHWSYTPSGLVQGAHTIVASDTDLAGNTGTASLAFTLNSVAPAVTETLVNDTGGSATDKITASPALTGGGDANAVVTLTEGATVLGTATADATGAWGFTPTALAQGTHTIVASETNATGNTGTASLSFTLDSVAPVVTETLANDTGTPGDNITSDPTLTGSADANGQVVLTEGATSLGAVTADATGHWNYTPTGLVQGAHTIVASDTDLAGNIGTASLAFTLQVAGRTITSSVAGPVSLTDPAADNPLVITSTGAVNATADGVDGTTAAIWTITNDGTVTSAGGDGISLAGAGIVSNGPTNGSAALISGTSVGLAIFGSGTVTNWGRVSGNNGIRLNAGGSVTNKATGSISASGTVGGGFGVGAGVYITHAAGTVTNNGSISGGAYGVAMAIGGSVTNTASIVGGEDGVVFNGGSGTVTNSGQIIATVDDGVGMFTGGSVTNAAGALIQGAGAIAAGVFITGGVGTVANSGHITTSGGGKFGVLLTGGGGSVTNTATGLIDGASTAGVAVNGAAGTVTNAGSIAANGTAAAAIDLEGGGSVINQTGGSISSSVFGVFITGGAGTVSNTGAISSAKYAAVDLRTGGSVTNSAGGSITGGTSGVEVQGGGAVSNAGTIRSTAALSAGVYLTLGGSVSNATGGALLGAGFGVFATGAAATVTNSGSISGPNGVGLQQGGSLTNNAGGVIAGTAAGVSSHGAPATISNAGSIGASAAGAAALDLEAGGAVTNSASGTVTGASFGVYVIGGGGTVTNAGSIAGTGNTGVDLKAGGSVTNQAGASISASGFGVAVYGSGGTVTNAGTISGSVSSVHFGGATSNNRLVVDPGAVFNGKVDAGGTGNTLELAQGASSGSIGGIGSFSGFTGFGTVAVDGGANWTLTGSNTAATVLDNGTLAIAGGGNLTITTAVDPASAGLFVLNTSSLLEVAADTGSGNQMSFLGASEAIIDTASLFGTNVGQSSYTGPLLENFGAGDSIDLKDVAAAGIALDYNTTTGLLQVASGGTGVASLLFQTASLGAGTFHLADDGSGHALITLA